MEEREINDYAPEDDETSEDLEVLGEAVSEQKEDAGSVMEDFNNKYLRLYAEFDNYKKRIAKEREDLLKYCNESLLYELLPAIDNLDLALKHSSGELNSGLVQGVEMTFKELHRILEKFGLSRIAAAGKQFDPSVHHAMMQVEKGDMDEKMVAEELRAGYLYRDKVLRPSLVAVSVKPQKEAGNQEEENNKSKAEDTENK